MKKPVHNGSLDDSRGEAAQPEHVEATERQKEQNGRNENFSFWYVHIAPFLDRRYFSVGVLLACCEILSHALNKIVQDFLSNPAMSGHAFQQLESDRQRADQLFSLRNAEFIGLPDVIQDPDFFGNGFVAGWNVQVEHIDRPDCLQVDVK